MIQNPRTMLSLKTDESITASKPFVIKCAEWCNAKSQVVKYEVTWTLSDRFKEGCDNADPIKSPAFRLGQRDEIEARLAIYPKGDPKGDANGDAKGDAKGDAIEYVSLYLQITSSYDASIIAKLVLTMNNIASYRKEMFLTRETFTPGLGWGFSDMYPRSEIWDESAHTVTCTINLVEDNREAEEASAGNDIPNAGQKRLLDGFRRLCTANLFSDVTLVVGEEQLRAHKAVLAAQSPVFEAMFVSELEETKRHEVNVGDLSVGVVKGMLHFIYTGSVEDLGGSAEGLLVASDKYGLDDLKVMCEESLTKNLTTENVCQIFHLSDLHRADKLKVKSAEFMRRHMHAVQQTDGWKALKLNCQTLLIEFFIEK